MASGNKTKIYIRGMGAISAQKTWGDEGYTFQPSPEGHRLACVEPPYEQWVDARQLRRMSRIIRMGVVSGYMALKEAGIQTPDAIITGTAYGCLDDTAIFLTKMIELKEEAVNPTPFIQSTHNTIGSQIALLLQCQGYNQTYTQEAFSFENSLLDAVLQLQENPSLKILAGGVDEITHTSHAIQQRFGIYRDNLQPGEGAFYFVLSGESSKTDSAVLESVSTLYKPSANELEQDIRRALSDAEIEVKDIDLVLTGQCGDKPYDTLLDGVTEGYLASRPQATFKRFCGEFPEASAYAVWLAAHVLKGQQVPEAVVSQHTKGPVQNVLILNQYFGSYYSIILLKSCHGTT